MICACGEKFNESEFALFYREEKVINLCRSGIFCVSVESVEKFSG